MQLASNNRSSAAVRRAVVLIALCAAVFASACDMQWLRQPVGAGLSAQAADGDAQSGTEDTTRTASAVGQGLMMIVAVDLTTSMTPRWLSADKQRSMPAGERLERSREVAVAKATELAQAAPPEIQLLILAYADRQTWQVYYGRANLFRADECAWPSAPRGSISNHQLPARELLKFLSIEDQADFLLYWISDFVPTGGSQSSVTIQKFGEPRLAAKMPATELLTHPRLKALTLLQVDLDQATQIRAALKQAGALEPEIRLDGQTEGFTPPLRLVKRILSEQARVAGTS